ncbi:AI-2E family transporter [Methanimicrococcus sp. OttesenSCG-928-J09]|nr:AI-2E family transporter [Methanimicrococcus sp. OttesenSCG-928-J09]
MLIVAALLFIVIGFLFYIKPVFIALILGVLATVLLDKVLDIFNKVTKSYSSTKRKMIALVSTTAIVLVVLILIVGGAMNLLANLNTVLDSLEDFNLQYNETAENLAEDLANISFEETIEIHNLEEIINYEPDDNNFYKMTVDTPPPAAAPGAKLLGLSKTDVVKSILTSGGTLMASTTGAISFIATTAFASCLIIPIMAGYYFKEKGNMRNKLVSMVPNKYQNAVGTTLKDVVNDMGAYTITKVLEAVVIIFLYCAGFSAVGIPHWLFAGIVMGLFNFVPYVGFVMPSIPIVVYAYTLGPEIMFAVIGIIIAIQLFDYFFILPNMVMKTVKISSFTAVILTLAGLKVAGVFGLVFAVPLYIFCKIILTACYKMLVSMYPDPTDPDEVILDEG